MTEVQSGTSLPHTHSVAWRNDLPGDVVKTIAFLQEDNWSTRLSPAQVEPVLDLARSTFTVTLCAERLVQQFPHLGQQEVLLYR